MKQFLIAAIAIIAAHAQDQRPTYRPFRYDEDWGSLADASKRSDWLDSLKYLGLGRPGWFITLGGEVRERYELLDQPGFGTGPADPTGYLLQRYLLSSDFHLGPHFRCFTELQSGLEEGRTGGPRATDLNRLDVHQAFLDWRISSSEAEGVTIRLGRQEIGFGSGRLIAPAEGLNLRRSLDGARVEVRKGRVVWNTDLLRLVRVNTGFFDNVPDHTQTFWGSGFVMSRPFWKISNIGVYYIGFDNKKSIFAKGAGREIRHTAGAHIWKRAAASWDYDDEGLIQWGSFRGAPIRAWALSADTGYTFDRAPLRPRVGFRSDAASGDQGAGHRALGTFDPLFSAVPVYSGPSALLGAANLIDATPSLRLRLTKDVSLALESSTFWRESLYDSVYTAFNTPIRRVTPNAGRYVATAPSVTVSWQATRHVFYSVIYTHFLTGSFFRLAPPNRNVTYATAWISYRF
jgi:hypothetical protein